MDFDLEEDLGNGLRYTESCGDLVEKFFPFTKIGWLNKKKPARVCLLWHEGDPEPISYLTLFSYRSRIGCVEVPVEGYGGVATKPKYRQKGYSSIVMSKSLEGASKRVPLVYLNGIHDYYGRYGFATCLLKSEMMLTTVRLKKAVERKSVELRDLRGEDLPILCEMANQGRRLRTGTLVRDPASYTGPRAPSDWDSGEEAWVAFDGEGVVGYTVFSAPRFGCGQPLIVTELCGANRDVIEGLVAELAAVAESRQIEAARFDEVPDSLAGSVLRSLGCEVKITYEAGGGWMGRFSDRAKFLELVRPELERRAGDVSALIEALNTRNVCPDDGVLLQLVTGYVSWSEEFSEPAEEVERVGRRCFPGAGSADLPLPYQYTNDWF